MGPALIIEVADHRGRLRSRTRVPEHGAGVGRGYGNDVIIDDPYADPVHLRVEPGDNGTWMFTDQGSVNGTWDSRSRRVGSGPVEPGLELRVGRSVVRFISPDQPVPPALVDAPSRFGASALLDGRTAAAVLVVAALVSTWSRFFGSTDSISPFDLVTPALASLLIGAVWAAGWAFTNRIVAQRFRFSAHLAWTMLVVAIAIVANMASEWLEFFAPATDLTWLEALGGFALGGLLLAGHFELLTDWSRRRRWAIASGATLGLFVIAGLFANAAETLDTSARAEPIGPLKPVSGALIPGTSIERFFERSNRLRGDLDETDGH